MRALPATDEGGRRFGDLAGVAADEPVVGVIDLANLAHFNDAYGFDAGDVLIAAATARLRTELRRQLAGQPRVSIEVAGAGRWLVHEPDLITLTAARWREATAAVAPLVFDVEECARLAGVEETWLEQTRSAGELPPCCFWGDAAPAVRAARTTRRTLVTVRTTSPEAGRARRDAGPAAVDLAVRRHFAGCGLRRVAMELWAAGGAAWDPPPQPGGPVIDVAGHQVPMTVECWELPDRARGLSFVR